MTKGLLRLWVLFLIFKLVVSAWLPMTPDEAYYWVWSRHLQLSYYDHPAMVAWLLWLGEPLLWLARAVRWPTVLLGHATLLIWLVILRDTLNEKQLRIFLVLAALSPLVGFGAIIVTPDVPLLFFWSCALLCLQNALKTNSTRWYALLGASLGLGFCSKYPIVLFVPILLTWLTFEKRWRDVDLKKALLTIVIGLLFSFPVIYWNYLNDFVSFRFQLEHGLGKPIWSPLWTLEYLGGQVLLIFPAVLFVVLKTPARSLRKSNLSWLFYFAWGPILFFFMTSFRSPVEANWPIAAYPSLLALAAIVADKVEGGALALRISMQMWFIAFMVLISNMVFPWLPLGEISERYEIMQAYRDLKPLAETYKPLYAGNYQIASILSFETKTLVSKARGYSRKDFFDELPESLPTEPRYFVIVEKEQHLPRMLEDMGHKTISRVRVDQHHFLVEVHHE